jgi:hypothetical protein
MDQANRKGIIIGLSATAVIFAFIVAFFAWITGTMKSSEPYQQALAIASKDPRVIAALGEPVQPGYFVLGSLSTGGTGRASLQIPLSGPRASGKLSVEATAKAGLWNLDMVVVAIGGQRIVLTPAADAAPSESAPLASATSAEPPPRVAEPSIPLPRVTTVDGPIRVGAQLSTDRVTRVMHGLFEPIGKCYATALAKNPSLAGTVSFTFVVDKGGRVRDARTDGSTLHDDAVLECALAPLRATTFSPPERGSETVHYAVVLAPAR